MMFLLPLHNIKYKMEIAQLKQVENQIIDNIGF